MGLDMYLEADVTCSDSDARVKAIFEAIHSNYPEGIADPIELYDSEWSRNKDPRTKIVRDLVVQHFPVVDLENNWIGAQFDYTTLTLPLAYWRKANQIHRWFVEKTQGGIDECQRSEVTRDQLFELRKLLKNTVWLPDHAPGLLPTQKGFFFGGTDYDDDYFADLNHTLEMLDRICEKGLTEQATIHYQASW